MIPKKIHYCWFGRGEKPKLAQKCIASWKEYCPDYEIIEWNEDNFDLDYNGFTRYCYDNKKWAFLSDFARLVVVAEHGGIYFDTDVELLKTLDPFCADHAVIGFENDQFVNSGQMMAAEAGHPVLAEMMERYDHISFYKPDGSIFLLVCTYVNTEVLCKHGLVKNGREQNVADVHVYPADWFNPLDSTTGILTKTENTVSIHWYSMSWISPARRLRVRIMRVVRRIIRKVYRKKR